MREKGEETGEERARWGASERFGRELNREKMYIHIKERGNETEGEIEREGDGQTEREDGERGEKEKEKVTRRRRWGTERGGRRRERR